MYWFYVLPFSFFLSFLLSFFLTFFLLLSCEVTHGVVGVGQALQRKVHRRKWKERRRRRKKQQRRPLNDA